MLPRTRSWAVPERWLSGERLRWESNGHPSPASLRAQGSCPWWWCRGWWWVDKRHGSGGDGSGGFGSRGDAAWQRRRVRCRRTPALLGLWPRRASPSRASVRPTDQSVTREPAVPLVSHFSLTTFLPGGVINTAPSGERGESAGAERRVTADRCARGCEAAACFSRLMPTAFPPADCGIHCHIRVA